MNDQDKLKEEIEKHKAFIDKIMSCNIPETAKHAYLITRIVFFDCEEIPPNYPEYRAILHLSDPYDELLDNNKPAEPYARRRLVSTKHLVSNLMEKKE